MRTLLPAAAVALCAAAGAAHSGEEKPAPPELAFTETFLEDENDLDSRGTNPFFVLQPEWTLVLEGTEGNEKVRLEIKVLHETKAFGKVVTRVVEERETVDGELKEVSRNYFAISKRTNSVYYFGEDVDVYEDGKVKDHSGSWLSGKEGARYGLMMAGTVCLGARYSQEIAPKTAMDRAEVVSFPQSIETPVGKFSQCIAVEETSPLEPGSKSMKLYAAGVGLLTDGKLRLVAYGVPNPAIPRGYDRAIPGAR
jgi:hypothetical protein